MSYVMAESIFDVVALIILGSIQQESNTIERGRAKEGAAVDNPKGFS